jgi:hypothetical protein
MQNQTWMSCVFNQSLTPEPVAGYWHDSLCISKRWPTRSSSISEAFRSKGRVRNVGLWRWSRDPTYFFE